MTKPITFIRNHAANRRWDFFLLSPFSCFITCGAQPLSFKILQKSHAIDVFRGLYISLQRFDCWHHVRIWVIRGMCFLTHLKIECRYKGHLHMLSTTQKGMFFIFIPVFCVIKRKVYSYKKGESLSWQCSKSIMKVANAHAVASPQSTSFHHAVQYTQYDLSQ